MSQYLDPERAEELRGNIHGAIMSQPMDFAVRAHLLEVTRDMIGEFVDEDVVPTKPDDSAFDKRNP